ncbi:hypothetical protein [Nocardia transvalensis]|uniref:hypothetical protein n=1 Tax=Nocardia transvalensis TaxID=37333 RepID=UPI0018963790|nr:hypothetical protein [Nocardia transvalensis]MBF6328430.1 hypothetical protein [Nocardia transvalensis]
MSRTISGGTFRISIEIDCAPTFPRSLAGAVDPLPRLVESINWRRGGVGIGDGQLEIDEFR